MRTINEDMIVDPPELSHEFTELISCVGSIRDAITKSGARGAHDAAGVYVESLTEAVMGVTAGLVQIAEALRDVADAMRETKIV